MSLSPGTKLAEYEILTAIGAGGMGEVYKARDTKLGREVAIKVLPAAFAEDKERLARFEREARLLASLNHPNIATIHDLEESSGVHFLVLEFVPGETLAERIKRVPIPIDEALSLFKQIAEGLEAAHEKGVIHRDLKPANVKITPEGKAKILDFGLAKAIAGEVPDQGLSESPTMTRGATEAGILLGTAPYMSPEQARGKAVDKRTDIWAFGCCLFEALTGKTTFLGETVSDTIARVIEREPDWQKLPPITPASIHRLLRRCLQKDQNRRMRDVGEARIEIEETLGQPAMTLADTEDGKGRSPTPFKAMALAAIAVAVVAIGIAIWSIARLNRPVPRAITRSVIPLAPHELLDDAQDMQRGGDRGYTAAITISPDGHIAAYVAERGLYLRAMDELEGRAIEGTEGARMPFFSPDSQWVGFWADGKLMRVAVSGGAPLTVAEVGVNCRGACWTIEGEIVFNTDAGQGLSRVSADGGEPEILTTTNHDQREKTHRLPESLPGGKEILFTLGTADIDSFDDASIAVLSLETGEYRVIIEGGMNARYSATGHLIYARAGSLLAAPFDLEELQVKDSPVPVLRGVLMRQDYGSAEFSVSSDGSLLYAPGDSWAAEGQVVWVDREGRSTQLIAEQRAFYAPRLSPDGRLLALSISAANDNVWMHDLTRGTLTRLTYGFDNWQPVWTPDGHRIVFVSTRTKPRSLFWQTADGSSQAELLAPSEGIPTPRSWSPDGRILAFNETNPRTGLDINVLSLDGDRTPEPFLRSTFNETDPMFSPNGRWIAYSSDESGQYEVYIRFFPSAEDKRPVSTGGGRYPVWNPNGKELFYRTDDKMMVVELETEEGLALGEPRLLFEKSLTFPWYDVTPNGQRFVMIEEGEPEPAPTQLILVQNWDEELKRLVPVN